MDYKKFFDRMFKKIKSKAILTNLLILFLTGILILITVNFFTTSDKNKNQDNNNQQISSDLKNVLNVFEIYKVENGSYPTDIASTAAKVSNNIILQSAVAANNTFCVNAYHKTDPSLRMSWNSAVGLQEGLCNGATIGNSIGGTVPDASRGINLSPGFLRWTLSGSATYNTVTKELSLGANGAATSPLVRIDRPKTIKVGGDFFATISSINTSITPSGGYHNSISYFASDGITPAANTYGYVGNGCAQKIDLNSWIAADNRCSYSGGPQIIYIKIQFMGSSSGYASADLKIRTPLINVID